MAMIDIKKIALDMGVCEDLICIHSDSHISIQGSPLFGIIIHFEELDSLMVYYFTVRTSSWCYDGERSDLHDIIGICFALFLKSINLKFTSYIIDEEHPFCDNEIFGRYIIPENNNIINNNDTESLCEIITLTDFFGHLFGLIQGISDENLPEELSCTIESAPIFKLLNHENCDTKIRNFPKWEYYRSLDSRISILNAPEIISFLRSILGDYESYNKLESIDATLYLYLNNGYCLPKKTSKIINKYSSKLNEPIIQYFFLENVAVACSENLIYIIFSECGTDAFRVERAKLLKRHLEEYELLLKPKNVIWEKSICPMAFEDLIYDLLSKDKRIRNIRKVSHTNERDGGRDLIADLLVPKQEIVEGDVVYEIKRIIIQCKAYKKGVGKNDVLDIRDTVDHYNCEGYFLAVSTYTKSTLTDHLDRIKSDGKIWIDWWTQREINEEVLKHPDLILKYRSLFTVSDMPYDHHIV